IDGHRRQHVQIVPMPGPVTSSKIQIIAILRLRIADIEAYPSIAWSCRGSKLTQDPTILEISVGLIRLGKVPEEASKRDCCENQCRTGDGAAARRPSQTGLKDTHQPLPGQETDGGRDELRQPRARSIGISMKSRCAEGERQRSQQDKQQVKT